MNTPFRKKVSRHFKRYKIRYMTGGICLTLVGVVAMVTSKQVDDTTLTKYNDEITNNLNLINLVGRNGHPGNVIYCNETKQVFRSHREATRELGIDNRDLWAYLKGIKPTARGFTFKKIGEAR